MDERRNKPDSGESRSQGFQLNIDQDQLTGMTELPPRRNQPPLPYSEQPMNRKIYYTEKERREEQKAHKKRNKIKSQKNRRVFSLVWLCMVLLVSVTLAGYLISGSNDFFAVGRVDAKAEVQIPENVTQEQLAKILKEKGVIAKEEFFSLYCSLTSDMESFVPGKYELATNLDYEDIINKLQGGDESRVSVKITFPEGMTALQVAALLEENKVCSAADFLQALNTTDFDKYDMIGALGSGEGKYYKLEGYLFPDTYEFYEQEDIKSVVGKMLDNFQNRISDDLQKAIDASGMSMDRVIILASIIQAEAANSTDMYKVSAVLQNRMAFGADYDIYRLECDSTMHYPYKTAKDVPAEGALPYGNYDTYQIQGLPAGAICNPGVDAITAAVKPALEAASYLYFCHAEDGTAYYASSDWEHQENLVLAGLV